MRTWFLLIGAIVGLAGCNDGTSPRDLSPPAAPRGLRSVTGDGTAYLSWLGNTESDVAGYRVYQSTCDAPGCQYLLVGSTARGTTNFAVTSLTNGVTVFFAVAAFDFAGNESDLSYDSIFDTPRPEGFAAQMTSYLTTPGSAGWDFSAYRTRAWDAPETDMFYGYNGSVHQMFVPDLQTDIQDAGYHTTLDAVDFAPSAGWSPTGAVELVVGHCYVVWTRDNHYAKFRVNLITVPPSGSPIVNFDWAYQVDAGNPELRARPAREEGAGRRPIAWIR
jgi:hypothetical protein